MQSLLILSVILLAASGLPVKELVHSDRIPEQLALRAPHNPLNDVIRGLNTTEYVFGGSRAQIGQFPMQAFISYTSTDEYRCGGSIISATHVLTAAHCTYDLVAASSFVMVGGVNVRNGSSPHQQLRGISRVVTHPGFDIESAERVDDIAVIEVSPRFELNNYVKLAKIVSNDAALLLAPTAVVSGYGSCKIENGTGVTSNDLLFAEVDLFSFSFCNDAWNKLEDTQFCAGAANRGIGGGDSGGPIQVRHNGQLVQIGVTSFGDEDVDAEHNQDTSPSVFTRISKYCNFIDAATAGVVKCGSVPTTVAPSTTTKSRKNRADKNVIRAEIVFKR